MQTTSSALPCKIGYRTATRLLMQAIHVLGDKQAAVAAKLQLGNTMMRDVGPGVANDWPTNEASSPITLTNHRARHKVLMLDRLFALPRAIAIPIVRNAGIGTDAGSRQYHQARMPVDEFRQHGPRLLGRMQLQWLVSGRHCYAFNKFLNDRHHTHTRWELLYFREQIHRCQW